MCMRRGPVFARVAFDFTDVDHFCAEIDVENSKRRRGRWGDARLEVFEM